MIATLYTYTSGAQSIKCTKLNMEESPIDDKYSLAFLHKLNNLSYQNKLLANVFFYEGYNLWHVMQQKIYEDIRIFSKTQKFQKEVRASLFLRVKDFCGGLLLFSMSVLAYIVLVLSRRKTLIYSVDRSNSKYKGDFRLALLYEALNKKNVSYVEYFHTVLGRPMLTSMFKRRRVAFYLEALNWLYKIVGPKKRSLVDVGQIDLACFVSEDERKYALNLIERFISETDRAKFRIRLITRALSRTNIKVIFAIDDVRYYNDLLIAGESSGIATIAIQHGHFTKYHVGWLKDPLFEGRFVVPEQFLVWSSYWKNELLRLGTHFVSEQIIVGGVKDSTEVRENIEKKRDDIVVLVPYETAGPKADVRHYIQILLKCTNVRVVFKLRPDLSKEQQLAEYGLDQETNDKFSATAEIKDVINSIDLVVGTYSTFLYDMLGSGVRIAMLQTESDYGEGMVINNLADVVSSGENSCEELRALSTRSLEEVKERRNRLVGEHPPLLIDTLANIIEKSKL